MKKLVILTLTLISYPTFAITSDLWNILSPSLPGNFSLGQEIDKSVENLGTPKLVEGAWQYYEERGVQYPLALKLVKGKVVGGNYSFLSPYRVVITSGQLEKVYKNWKIREAEGHDFGRYRFYMTAESDVEVKLIHKGEEWIVQSLKWGDWK